MPFGNTAVGIGCDLKLQLFPWFAMGAQVSQVNESLIVSLGKAENPVGMTEVESWGGRLSI